MLSVESTLKDTPVDLLSFGVPMLNTMFAGHVSSPFKVPSRSRGAGVPSFV